MLPFTLREMKRAWRQNLEVSSVKKRQNTHRLLLFYAVECGLKAVIMKRENVDRTDKCPTLSERGHDINGLLEDCCAGNLLRLESVQMSSIKDPKTSRQVQPKEFNQMWRYGGETEGTPADTDIENRLLEIVNWIKDQL